MKPVLKRAPSLKLTSENNQLLMRYDYQPINLELVTLHIVLSKILQEVLSMKAANCMLKDICNYNRQKRPNDI